MNVEITDGLSDQSWPAAAFWAPSASPDVSIDAVIENSVSIAVGVDLGGLDDLSSMTIIGLDDEDGEDVPTWSIAGHAWVTVQGADRRDTNLGLQYRDYENEGSLTITAELDDDIAAIVEVVRRIHNAGKLRGVGIDAYGAEQLAYSLQRLVEEDDETPDDERLIRSVSQGYKLGAQITTLERKLVAGQTKNDGSALLRDAFGNVVLEQRGPSVTFTRRNTAMKIDPAISTLNAAAIAMMAPPKEGFDLSAMIGGLAGAAVFLPVLLAGFGS